MDFSSLPAEVVGPLPRPPTTQRQNGARTLHHHSAFKHCSSTPKSSNPRQRDSKTPEYFFPTVSSTNWTENSLVCKCHSGTHPTSCTGLYPNYPISGQYWEASLSISSCLHTSCHCAGYSSPARLLQLFPTNARPTSVHLLQTLSCLSFLNKNKTQQYISPKHNICWHSWQSLQKLLHLRGAENVINALHDPHLKDARYWYCFPQCCYFPLDKAPPCQANHRACLQNLMEHPLTLQTGNMKTRWGKKKQLFDSHALNQPRKVTLNRCTPNLGFLWERNPGLEAGIQW